MSTSLPTLKITDDDGRGIFKEVRLEQGLSAESLLDLNRPFKLDG
jgi:hypothetical protein